MKSAINLYFLIFALLLGATATAQPLQIKQLNTRVDNLGYWNAAIAQGLTAPNPQRSVPPAIFTGSQIRAVSVISDDSPDVVLITGSTSQSENSVFINPQDRENALNSNNSTNTPGGGTMVYGADYLYTFDGGANWDGSINGAGGGNSGDPTTAIGMDGRYYVGYITNGYGMGVSYSTNQGNSWTMVQVAPSPGGSGLDKNHLWIDNSTSSPYEGNLYNAWTAFGGADNDEIEVSYSTDGGLSWSAPHNVSGPVNAGSHCQGVNIQTGPNGEVYVTFAIYDNWPSPENSIGLARSFDGGVTWEAFRIIDNIKGIRNADIGINMRINSFPVTACDISTGDNRGNLYVTWTNQGVPGVNSGSDVDVYMIRSEDNGTTWSDPIRVNQDPQNAGKKHYQGWITSDAVTGTLSMVWYDNREVSGGQVETFCGNSYDAGNTWEDFKVSDVAFTPTPIPGLASQYFGDYLGISARNGKVYPVWTDNRTGTALTYTSPYLTSTMVAPTNLNAQLNDATGQVNLSWTHNGGPTFLHYNIYRGLELLGTSTLPFFTDFLPAYGSYRYQVTAVYQIEGESAPAIADVQWGSAQAEINPPAIEVYVSPEETTSTVMSLSNVGELPLEYTSAFSLPGSSRSDVRAYCTGIGGCNGEYIAGVLYGDNANYSGCGGYEDYSSMSYLVYKGGSVDITVNNGSSAYPTDVCGIWVDWNQNQSFLDDAPVTVSGSPGPGPYTATLTVPDDAKNGTARIRIRIKRGGTLSPCGSAPNGEVEDYSLNVLAWVTATPMEGTIQSDTSQDITFNFSAVGMGLGDYLANYSIFTNDPNNSEIVVPVTMHVANAAVMLTADKDSICYGGSTTLHANVTGGGSGTFTYSWVSNPAGFTSTEQNPTVAPLVTTTYYVTATDGTITLENNITITVIPLPQVNLGEDMSVCQGGEAVLDAGAGFASYLWSNGQTSQSITVTEGGIYWVEVTNDFGCSTRDSVNFIVNPLPSVNLGENLNICEGSTVVLSAGTGFATYLWNTGATGSSIETTEAGEYWVTVTDQNGCSNSDTIVLTMVPRPVVNLGEDQTFCEGTSVTLNAGAGFTSYLWSNGATTESVSISTPGEYWVEVSDLNSCTGRDTVMLTMDPLPSTPQITEGPATVDNYLNPASDFTSSVSTSATSYEWKLEPAGAGAITGTGVNGQVTWMAGFSGTAQVSVKGINACGSGSYSQLYPVTVYSSQGIDEKNAVSGIKIFPNPNKGTFMLQLSSRSGQQLNFRITTSVGTTILDSKESIPAGLYQKNFNLSTLPGGTYYLIILDSHDRMLNRQQVIVE